MTAPRFGALLSLLSSLLLIGWSGLPAAAETSPWSKQAPWPTSFDLHGVSLLSPDEAWIVGSAPLTTNQGDVVHTLDGGITWEKTVLSTSQINAVFFLDPLHGWIVGNDTFRTTDGGTTWTHENSNGTLYAVQFVDPQRGFACGNGGLVYRSIDGGHTWLGTAVSGWTHRGLFFLDAQRGWSVDIGGGIHHTTDGGVSWSTQYSNPAASNLGMVQFFDAAEGWAVGGNHFLHTTNGGQTWVQAAVPPNTWANDAWFGDAQHGIAVGYQGNVVRTTDGGQSWTEVAPQGGRPDLWSVRMSGSAAGFLAGAAAMLYSTSDGGATWENRQSGGWAMTHALDALSESVAWAACEGGEVLRTTNGGLFWDRATPAGVDVYGSCRDVSFADLTTGFVVLDHEFFGGGDWKVDRSTDGGRTWEVRSVFPNALSLDRVVALSPTVLLVTGAQIVGEASLIRSTDGGATWADVTPAAGDIGDLDFVDAQKGWMAGARILRSTDGGITWVTQLDDGSWFLGISFADAANGWAVGPGGRIVHTSNGGTTWSNQESGTTGSFWGVSALSALECWAVLLDGKVAHTEDGGATWAIETVDVDPLLNLEAIVFTSSGRGWVGGNFGIFHRGPVPAEVNPGLLAQEPGEVVTFPNPMRQTLSIRLQQPAGGPRALEVLDVGGRCVRRLALDSFGPEPRVVTWDGKDTQGEDVPSGRYFIRAVGRGSVRGFGVTRIR